MHACTTEGTPRDVSMDTPQSSPCTKTTQVLNVKGRGGGTRLAVSRWLKAYLDKFIY